MAPNIVLPLVAVFGEFEMVIYSITKVVQFKLARVPLFMYLHWLVMMQTKIPSQILEWLDSLV